MSKIRLDVLLIQKGFIESRNKAQALIMAGKVRVGNSVITKAGTLVAADSDVEIDKGLPYVGRGGFKLEAALDHFQLNPEGMICADIGASTGGFTDVLLQRQAAQVYAVDVGYGQLAWKLRRDKRVVVMERTNARYLDTLPQLVDLVTIDVSFISLKLIFPAVKKWLASPGRVIALVKPQFEAGKTQVGKGGVVRDRSVHKEVLEKVVDYANSETFDLLGLMPSPITGPAGNHEFLIYLGWRISETDIDKVKALEHCLSMLDIPHSQSPQHPE